MAYLTVATVNVNGLRAAVRKGMGKWFKEQRKEGLDVLCLQETKISKKKEKDINLICDELGIKRCDFHLQENANKSRLGGVAIWVNPDTCQTLLYDPKQNPFEGTKEAETCDFSGRWQEILIKLKSNNKEIMIVNSYYHSADERKPNKMENKHKFFAKTTHRMRELISSLKHNNFILVGDINTMHKNIDIKAFEDNIEKAGFLPEERAWLDLWFAKTDIESKAAMDKYNNPRITNYQLPDSNEFKSGLGLIDVIREKYGDGEDGIIYSQWTWKGRNFDKNAGRRIDYQIATKSMAKSVVEAKIQKQESYDKRWSDHAPVVVTYSM